MDSRKKVPVMLFLNVYIGSARDPYISTPLHFEILVLLHSFLMRRFFLRKVAVEKGDAGGKKKKCNVVGPELMARLMSAQAHGASPCARRRLMSSMTRGSPVMSSMT